MSKQSNWPDTVEETLGSSCPGCGKHLSFRIRTIVNAQQSPEAVEDILALGSDVIRCTHCGYSARVDFPLLYVDPVHGACIQMVDDFNDDAGAISALESAAEAVCHVGGPNAVRRIVRSHEELREQITIVNHDLDGRVIELMKPDVARLGQNDELLPVDATSLSIRLVEVDHCWLRFLVVYDSSRSCGASPVQVHYSVYDFYRDALAGSSICKEQPYVLDREWANAAFDKLVFEGCLDLAREPDVPDCDDDGYVPVKLFCEGCGRLFEGRYKAIVDAAVDGDLMQREGDGDHLGFACPHCGEVNYEDMPRLLVDSNHKALVLLATEAHLPAKVAKMLEGAASDDDVARRVVTSSAQLRERFLVFASGLDDRGLELFKLKAIESMVKDGDLPQGAKQYEAILTAVEGEWLHFKLSALVNGKLETVCWRFHMDLYRKTCDEFLASDYADDQPLMVDDAWASSTMFLMKQGVEPF